MYLKGSQLAALPQKEGMHAALPVARKCLKKGSGSPKGRGVGHAVVLSISQKSSDTSKISV